MAIFRLVPGYMVPRTFVFESLDGVKSLGKTIATDFFGPWNNGNGGSMVDSRLMVVNSH